MPCSKPDRCPPRSSETSRATTSTPPRPWAGCAPPSARTDYPPTEIPLTPGTVLALYTDGLVETPGVDMDDAMSGLATQLARASAQPVGRRLATSPIDHARQTPPRADDIVLLLIGLATAG
ncbi:SpoIIE family protein phosphatase [Streptomyces sp. NPDC040750]|uniref:SpoIIE family protein phosphatase n=1 Tax=Streptomyces sp. NPDC040750 TaxID=3154491 RepID=UPI0033EEA4C8